ncbi:MAG: hypothetical protein KDB10_10600, partial [Acidimicrobiales bacterium]|nr:hypothetical protein [Acidimicrobiales bacterium]
MTDRAPDDHIPTRLLVVGMAGPDGVIVTDDVLPVAEVCGQPADQVRDELDLLVDEGLFATEDGRRYRPTDAGRALLDS